MNSIKTIPYVCVLFILIQVNFSAAQNPKVFPTDCSPNEIAAKDVEVQAKSLFPTCGFGSAYISNADLEDLLNVETSVGVRFYISMEKVDQGYADLTAVAIDQNGKEIGSKFQRTYLTVKPLEVSTPSYAKGLNLYEAEKFVKNLVASKSNLKPYVGYLGAENLQRLMKTQSDGIRVYPSEIQLEGKTYHTMSFGSVAVGSKGLTNTTDIYLQAVHPCPIACGGDGETNYLWNR